MKRLISGLVVMLIAPLAAVVAFAGPANAASASISMASSGVIYNTCYDLPFSYDVTLSAGDSYWHIYSDLYGPDGVERSGAVVASSLGDPTAGSDTVQVCSSDPPGTYTLRSSFEYWDYADNTHTVNLPTVTIDLREAASRTALKLLKTQPGKHTVRITTSDERPAGFFPTQYADVYLQKYTRSGWVKIRGTAKMTDNHGIAVVTFKHNHATRIKVRAVTRPQETVAGSVSPTIRFR